MLFLQPNDGGLGLTAQSQEMDTYSPHCPDNPATWHTPGGREIEFFLQVCFLVQNKSFFKCDILSVGGSNLTYGLWKRQCVHRRII